MSRHSAPKKPEPSAPSRPTIEVTGHASSQEAPQKGSLIVTITSTASTPHDAWSRFQDRLGVLRDGLKDVASIGNVIPSESTAEVTKTLRTVTEISVSAEVKVTFEPDRYSDLLKTLVENRFKFATPKFEFTTQPSVSHDLLNEASKDARLAAQAIATGIGATVGRLTKIHIGEPTRVAEALRPHEVDSWRSRLGVDDMRSLSVASRSTYPEPTWDDRLWADLDLALANLRTYKTVATITATFELIESPLAAA